MPKIAHLETISLHGRHWVQCQVCEALSADSTKHGRGGGPDTEGAHTFTLLNTVCAQHSHRQHSGKPMKEKTVEFFLKYHVTYHLFVVF